MNPLKKLYCRAFQTVFRIALPILPYRNPVILHSMAEIPGALNAKRLHRPLLVTDKSIRELGLTRDLERVLKEHQISCAIYDGTRPNPTTDMVMEALRIYRENRCDSIIAFGGGSPMDCAKAMLYFGKKLGAPGEITFAAVPTTAGTGSEVTSFAVLTDPVRGIKYPLVDDGLLPDQAILDPALLAGVPPAVTADTGMDVLAHAAEAYVARGATPYSDALAEKAFTLAWANLPAAFAATGDSPAKGEMLLASNLAGLAFNAAGLGLCHSLAHALGGRFHVPHGRLNALIFPHVLTYNAAGRESAAKYAHLAGLCGLAPTPRALSAGWSRLRARLGLPDRLAACGVEAKKLHAALDELAAAALGDLCAPSNPRRPSAEDVRALLKELA